MKAYMIMTKREDIWLPIPRSTAYFYEEREEDAIGELAYKTFNYDCDTQLALFELTESGPVYVKGDRGEIEC